MLSLTDYIVIIFVLLRQLLENIASFVGSGRFSYILEQIGLNDSTNIAKMTNILSHKNLLYI